MKYSRNLLIVVSLLMIESACMTKNIGQFNSRAHQVLGYNPALKLINPAKNMTEITVTCHGYGANNEIGEYVAQHITTPILTFNFNHTLGSFDTSTGDYQTIEAYLNKHAAVYGTLNEYLIVIFMLRSALELGAKKINLYGYSAGGGAIINALAVLNDSKYASDLQSIGVTAATVESIKQALSSGLIILDVPLKSAREILTIRPNDLGIQVMEKRYRANGFEPIDNIDKLAGLKLNIVLYQEKPDQILGNRDDELFYQKLKQANPLGMTKLVIGTKDGHFGQHEPLWKAVKSELL